MSKSSDDRDVEARPSTSVPDDDFDGRYRHTRTSALWVAVSVAILFGVALVDFIAQNTNDVRIEFFTVHGNIPVAVALLAAALSGAIVVVAIGIGRVVQLRLSMHRQRRHAHSRREHADKE